MNANLSAAAGSARELTFSFWNGGNPRRESAQGKIAVDSSLESCTNAILIWLSSALSSGIPCEQEKERERERERVRERGERESSAEQSATSGSLAG